MNEKTLTRDTTMASIKQLLADAVARNASHNRHLNAPLPKRFLDDQPQPKLSHGQALKLNELLPALLQIAKMEQSINEQLAVYNLQLTPLRLFDIGRMGSEIKDILSTYRIQLRAKAPSLIEDKTRSAIPPVQTQIRKAS